MAPRVLLALAAGLSLADASIVTLALPPVLAELDGTVEGVAAVLGVYTLVLAVALPPAAWLRGRLGTGTLGAAGLALFGAASAGCGLAGSMEVLIALRAVQAAGAAGALVAAFDTLGAGEPGPGRRMWFAAAIAGTAAGPALGGALTEALDWRAIFFVQTPVALAAAVVVARTGRGAAATPLIATPSHPPAGPSLALACVSAALVSVVFLLVLLLVTGWSVRPLGAAATVTVLPLAALAAARIPGDPRARAAAGALLLGGGVLALAFLPEANVAWTIAPQVLAGAGMGLALGALAGELMPERTPGEAARLLAVRHLGITLALAILAPVAASQVDEAVVETRERGAALVLDARLPPVEKIELAGALTADLDPVDPRETLRRSLDRKAPTFADDPQDRAAYAELRRRADETLTEGVTEAFAPAFLITGAIALLGALGVLPARRRVRAAFAGAALLAAVVPLAGAVLEPRVEPEPVAIADPCTVRRDLPSTGGLEGAAQDAVLIGLDRAACRFGSSREELALALADEDQARAYERKYGVDTRSLRSLLQGALGL